MFASVTSGRPPFLSWCLVIVGACVSTPSQPTRPEPTDHQRQAESPTPSPARPATPRPPTQQSASSDPLQGVVTAALAQVEHPAAAVMLSIPDRRVLASAGHRDISPTTTALPPGSTVKPLLAYAAAREGVIEASEQFDCQQQDPHHAGFQCFATHGELDLTAATTVSCNLYFFDLARRMGYAEVRRGLQSFGFGRPTQLVNDEASGRVPTLTWLQRQQASLGSEGWARMIGTGHGPIEVSLLQLASAYIALAQSLQRPPESVDTEVVQQLRLGLRNVVQHQDGTGTAAAVESLCIAGKTGTAEQTYPRGGEDELAENGWFVGYAPAAAPQVVVAVMVRGGGAGGRTAAPIAGTILRGWQRTQPPSLRISGCPPPP